MNSISAWAIDIDTISTQRNSDDRNVNRNDDDAKSINALVSIDMNGLKVINDTEGHAAGDKALETISACFLQAVSSKESVYRIGGDEFVIICRRITEDDVRKLIDRIRNNISKTKYRCAIGYSYSPNGADSLDDMLSVSDEKMYADKSSFYAASRNGEL